MLAVKPIRRRRLYEGIVEQLEALILAGELQPGASLPSERELMAEFQVGRSAVREALFALQRRGLVTVQSGERANVTHPSSHAVVGELSTLVRFHLASSTGAAEFRQARMLFETGVTRLAAELADQADLDTLRRLLAANGEARRDQAAFIDTDVAYHLGIAAVSRNSIFIALHSALAEWLRRERASSITVPGSPEAAYRAHRRILAAIEARDPDRAAAAMRAHLEQVSGYIDRASGA